MTHGSSERENLEGSQAQPPRQLEADPAGNRQVPPVRTDELTLPGIGKCPQCGQMKLSHRVCKNCGYYNGVQVIVKKDEEKNA